MKHMKINITDKLAVGYEVGSYVLVNTDGNVEAVSGNTIFNDADWYGNKDNHIPKGSYAVWKVGDGCRHEEQLGCCLEFVCHQQHSGDGGYEEGNI